MKLSIVVKSTSFDTFYSLMLNDVPLTYDVYAISLATGIGLDDILKIEDERILFEVKL